MLKRLFVVLLIVLVCPCLPAAAAVDDADAAVAARLSDMGTAMLRQKEATAAHYRACVALLKAAAKLNPQEARYPRLMVEALLALEDTDGAIEALKQYRTIMPDDLGAQLQLIELQLSKMETLDARLNYANQLLGAGDRIHGDVRSAVATRAARMLLEQDRTAQANALLEQAVRLNPRNADALRLRYQQGADQLSPFQKIKLLVEMVKTNPLQPSVVAEMASRLADFGLVKPSLEWYFQAMRLYQFTGQPIPLDFAIEYGAELFLADRYENADGMAIRLLAGDKYDIDALYLRLLCARNTAGEDDDRSMRNLARKTLLARLTDARDRVLNPTTQPATRPALPEGQEPPKPQIDPLTGLPRPPMQEIVELNPDLLPDLSEALAKAAEDSPARDELVNALSALAWYTLYFDPKPEVAEPLLASLAKLLPADDLLLVRLQGWLYVVQNKPEQAKLKLEAIADRDPLAAVGLIRLTPATDPEANHRGRKLLTEYPARMLAAFLKDALRERAIKVVAREDAAMIVEVLNAFPMRFLEIIEDPKSFYTVTGDPMMGQFAYRQPLLVKVTLNNISPFDITIGPGGVLRNDLWFDAQIRGVASQSFPGTAYDRVTGVLVLRPGQSVSQVVRIDQGPLGNMLGGNPTQPFDIQLTAVTNPIATEQGVGAGAGGYRVPLRKSVVRDGFAITAEREVNGMLENLVSGNSGRIAAMDLMAAYMTQNNATPDERITKLAPLFQEKLVAVKVDPSPSIRSWAQFVLAGQAPNPAKAQQVQEMSRSGDWQARLLAGLLSSEIGPETRKGVLTELTHDAEPAIKDYAAAMLETLSAPATQPAN